MMQTGAQQMALGRAYHLSKSDLQGTFEDKGAGGYKTKVKFFCFL
jgi:hypothetical protein